jgi:hypothetical protein
MGISLAARHWATGVAAHSWWATHPRLATVAAHSWWATHPRLATVAAPSWWATHPRLTTVAAHPWWAAMPIASCHTRLRKLLIGLAKLPLFFYFLFKEIRGLREPNIFFST